MSPGIIVTMARDDVSRRGGPVDLSTAATDRAAGVLLTQVCGGPGVDSTRLTVRIAEIAATGADLLDAGIPRPASGSSGDALLCVAPVALAHLADPDRRAAAARAVAALIDTDPVTAQACVLWCAGIADAVRTGSFDGVRGGLDQLPAPSRDRWARWLADAEQSPPARFRAGGDPVATVQAAYAAVRTTPVPSDEPAEGSFPCLHLQHALTAARTANGPPDGTAAALSGALLGARWGASAVPFGWRRQLPGLTSRELVRLAVLAARGGEPGPQGWPQCDRMPYDVAAQPAVPHPCDQGVLLGNVGNAGDTGCAGHRDAVVSLCRRGRGEVPAPSVEPGDHVEVRLQDRTDPAENPNLEFVIDDAARAVATLRDEGRRVLLHCVHGQSRTPTVAARYAVLRGMAVTDALADVVAVIPGARANITLRRALHRLGTPRRGARTL
ncbi:MAG: ADP-ribosylglycohydrolase family protein [Pseudonocardiaceae bacterium]